MRTISRLFLTALAWLFISAIAAVVLELTAGRPVPGLNQGITLVLLMPIIAKIWAIRVTKALRVVWLVAAAANILLLVWLFANL